jgi:bifunctional non-homologous end joining protein LigD
VGAAKGRGHFHGERLRGRYGLFPIGGKDGRSNDWMIHRMDPPGSRREADARARRADAGARRGQLPPSGAGREFEVKWDGVRAIAYARPGRLRLESRNLNDITDAYPEVRGCCASSGCARRCSTARSSPSTTTGGRASSGSSAGCTSPAERGHPRLAADTPVVYAIFDLLYLDGESLMGCPTTSGASASRRARAGRPGVAGARPHGGQTARAAAGDPAQGLEGVVAKRLDSRYEPGRRTAPG